MLPVVKPDQKGNSAELIKADFREKSSPKLNLKAFWHIRTAGKTESTIELAKKEDA